VSYSIVRGEQRPQGRGRSCRSNRPWAIGFSDSRRQAQIISNRRVCRTSSSGNGNIVRNSRAWLKR